MVPSLRFVLIVAAACSLGVGASSALAEGPAYTNPAKADADFAFQGEYEGEVQTEEGARKFGVQVIALGNGKFHAVGYPGGLPGAGWVGGDSRIESDGERKDATVVFRNDHATVTLENGKITAVSTAGTTLATLKKVERKSPTLGAPPPQGAIVLFDGKHVDEWENGRLEDGCLVQGTTSKRKFGSHKLHLEFRLPYQPEERGQGRGNSGLYLQGRYETQILDSFGLTGENNECGGIYTVKKPDINMCLPPLSWQTYDVDYTAARFDDQGKLVANPRITVSHNGVVIHRDVELPGERSTTAAPSPPGPAPGPVYLQDHGNPVRYRNIWVVETKTP